MTKIIRLFQFTLLKLFVISIMNIWPIIRLFVMMKKIEFLKWKEKQKLKHLILLCVFVIVDLFFVFFLIENKLFLIFFKILFFIWTYERIIFLNERTNKQNNELKIIFNENTFVYSSASISNIFWYVRRKNVQFKNGHSVNSFWSHLNGTFQTFLGPFFKFER